MTSDEVLDLFRQRGALLDGHFRLSSGRHSHSYLQCALVLQHPEQAARLGAALAERLRPLRAATILSPALGGIIIGHEVARALGVRAVFAERQDGMLTLRRGFALSPAEPVIVIEDVLTTGGSTRETIQVAKLAGGHVVGSGAIIDRRSEASDLQVPFEALASIPLPTWELAHCPLCARGIPISKPGSRP